MFVLYFLSLVFLANGENITVEVVQGKVTGTTDISRNGRTYYKFLGIPYAEPPIGDLRIEYPVPLKSWPGVFDATKEGPSCMQYGMGVEEGEEDCLTINIFTPKVKSESLLPVLVWLHGGGFIVGSANDYDPYLVMDRDFVLVMPQYRLGFLGFSHMRTYITQGNFGLMDQHVALRWIKKNIKAFGGDPDRITLGGDCAGGSSALFQMISPLSRGSNLFHRVMSFSGVPLNPWSLRAQHRRLEMMVSESVGCPHFDHAVYKKCIKELPAIEIMNTTKNLLEGMDFFVGNADFAPIVQLEEWMNKTKPFLPKDPYISLVEGNFQKVPVFLSVTKDIGSYLVDSVFYEYLQEKSRDNIKFVEARVPLILEGRSKFQKEMDGLSNIFDFYIPSVAKEDLVKLAPELALYLGDAMYNAGIVGIAEILSKFDIRTVLMRFDYAGGPKFFDLRHPDPSTAPPLGDLVSQGDDLFFFLPAHSRTEPTPEQDEVVKLMLDILEDFVYGRLDEKSFPSYEAGSYLSNVINSEGKVEQSIPFASAKRVKYMRKIFENQHIRAIQEAKPKFPSKKNRDEL